MEKTREVSNLFRKRLKGELERWRSEEIVTDEQAGEISRRYALDQLRSESTGTLILAIYIIGGVLVSAGVVSFVAAHWDAIPRAAKLCLIVAAMLACHTAGYWLWKVAAIRPMLGHGLITLGTLIFGVNIGLIAQIFHIRANFYNGFGAWAIGALVMAYVIRSIPNAFIAVATSFIWFCGWTEDNEGAFCYYPFVAAAIFLPLAYWKRSVVIFLTTILAMGASIVSAAVTDAQNFRAAILTILAVGQLFFAWSLMSARSRRHANFAGPTGVLGAIILAVLCYAMSFHVMSQEWIGDGWNVEGMWLVPSACAVLAAVTMWILAIGNVFRSAGIRPVAVGFLLTAVLVPAGVAVFDWIAATVLINAALVGIVIGLIWSGVATEDRRLFWSGLVLAGAVITGRFLEYETDLLVKAAVFVLLGVALIFGGVMFESYLRKRRLAHE